MDIKKIYNTHNSMTLEFIESENGLRQISFDVRGSKTKVPLGIEVPPFLLSNAGRNNGFHPALNTSYSSFPLECIMAASEINDKFIKLSYKHKEMPLICTVEFEKIPDSAVMRSITTVENTGTEAVTLTSLSSLFIQGLASEGLLPWFDSKKVRVYYCMQNWHGEGQWRTASLEELGVYPLSTHPCTGSANFSSIGSWSTGRYLPMAVIEDMETQKVYYFQIETSTSWNFEIGFRNNWDQSEGALFLNVNAASEKYTGWSKVLNPGECFTTVPVAFGCCTGSFDEAVRELTRYRRNYLKPAKAWKDEMPVFFNDYMNCLWGNPSEEKLRPLIDAASEAGMEGFCIDAGWFDDFEQSWGTVLGDWEEGKGRFGRIGLKGIVDYIKTKNMIPGVWLEIEVCNEKSKVSKNDNTWFLMRNGSRVGGPERYFFDYSNSEVRAYMHSIIDNLIAMGIGFIKNDYNLCTGNGHDVNGNAANGLLENSRAFYSFIDEVRKKYPRLILENCGSGAMRQDYGILSHFHLQSISDQEIYHLMPSIVIGSSASILPEQMGIWAYPYPLKFEERSQPELLKGKEYQERMADGEETVFNMVTGLCGNLYLSGRIDTANFANSALIKEAVALYKRERVFIRNAYPVWPIGFNQIYDNRSWASLGLQSENRDRMLVFVWRRGSPDEYALLPLKDMGGKNTEVRQLYPSHGYNAEFYYSNQTGKLSVKLDKAYTARVFEVKVN